MSFDGFMQLALLQAKKAATLGEVPVGALVILEEPGMAPKIISEAFNRRETDQNPVGHAELLAIEAAAQRLKRWRLTGCTLYVTLEPCVMCAGAIVLSREDRVIFGATDPKTGAVNSLYKILEDSRLNHRPEVVGGILENECSIILKDFFAKKRL